MNKIFLSVILFVISFNTPAQNMDIDILKEINLNRNRSLDPAFRLMTKSALPISMGLPVIIFGISQINKDSILKRKSIYIVTCLATSMIISTALKYSVNRPRPYVTYPIIERSTNEMTPSFPSGHSTAAFSTATSLCLVYPKWYIILPSYLWASAVAYSRMDLGVHYPSDVLGGIILATGSSYICHRINKGLSKK